MGDDGAVVEESEMEASALRVAEDTCDKGVLRQVRRSYFSKEKLITTR